MPRDLIPAARDELRRVHSLGRATAQALLAELEALRKQVADGGRPVELMAERDALTRLLDRAAEGHPIEWGVRWLRLSPTEVVP